MENICISRDENAIKRVGEKAQRVELKLQLEIQTYSKIINLVFV